MSSSIDYQSVKDFINRQIERREQSNGSKSQIPSKYWQDFNKLAGYVRRLQNEDLKHIRYHTWHLTADSYQGYYFFPERAPGVLAEYLNMVGSLDGFKPSETEYGLGYDTEHGKLSIDLLRYMRVLSDLYSHGKISRNGNLSVFEIGGGYGQLARILLNFNPQTIYVICDLEETLFFQAVYLINELGAEKVKFLTGEEPENFQLVPGTVYLLPQSLMHVAEKYRFDLAINQQSMQEMRQDQVDNYCNLIEKTCRYFYSCNLDQHIDFIVNRTEIVQGLNDYLTKRFEVEWSSKRKLVSKLADVEKRVGTSPRSRILVALRKFFGTGASCGSASTCEQVQAQPEDTIYGDYRVPRMIFKV